MPELPEVETIRRQLIDYCRGETLAALHFRTPALLKNCSAEEAESALTGRQLTQLERKGKFLIFNFQENFLVFHLGMSGIFVKEESDSRFPQHIHAELHFRSQKKLFYQDVRKFGKIRFYRSMPELPNVGIDPLRDDLTAEQFAEMLSGRKSNIKLFLMNQSHIAGIGNIYASEILHLAKISPFRKTNELTSRESRVLWCAIREVLTAATENFGTTYSAYRTVTGETGQNQHFLRVYQREGQPCRECGEKIQKVVMGNRSTFYCPKCQQ